MTKIIVGNKGELTAQGNRTNGNCKPIFCIDSGEVFASITCAAEAINVHMTALSQAVNGKVKRCKGKRYCFVSNVIAHLEEIASAQREREEKIRAYDEMIRQQNAAKEAEAEFAKRKANCEKLQRQLEKEMQLMHEAEEKAKLYEDQGSEMRYENCG